MDSYDQRFSVDGCDLEMAADTIRESLRLAEIEAKGQGKKPYYSAAFLSALYPFMEKPSKETSIPLLKVAPHLHTCFKSCSPGGKLYESKHLLQQDINLSSAQMTKFLAERLVALSEILAPKLAKLNIGSTRNCYQHREQAQQARFSGNGERNSVSNIRVTIPLPFRCLCWR